MIWSSAIVEVKLTPPLPSNDTLAALTGPEPIAKFCADAKVVAVVAFPLRAPSNVPATRVALEPPVNVVEGSEDTMTLVNNYVDQLPVDLDKEKLKNMIKETFVEAQDTGIKSDNI